MKIITNILLVVALFVYIQLPLFEVELFSEGITGFSYTADTLTDSDELLKKLFALLPFLSIFGGIGFNCLKHRYWGGVVAFFVALGLAFYVIGKNYTLIQTPEVCSFSGIGLGFTVGYGLMVCAFASSIISLLPFNFNLRHELDKMHIHLPKGKHFHKE